MRKPQPPGILGARPGLYRDCCTFYLPILEGWYVILKANLNGEEMCPVKHEVLIL
jgi:hypothetical protein